MSDEQYQTEMDRKKAEVRARLDAQSASKRKKKGFMTPERKKKLRQLLRNHYKKKVMEEQEKNSKERRAAIDRRCGEKKSLDNLSDSELRTLCKEYHSRVCEIQGEIYDVEKMAQKKDYQIDEMNIAVNDLRGKFIKPSLKKVSKYENKFAKLQKKAQEFNFRNQLKTVKKKEFSLNKEDNLEHKKPDWGLGRTKSGHELALAKEVDSKEVTTPE